MRGQRLRLPGRAVELDCRLVDGGHQIAQHADGVVDRIGNRAGDVFGDRGLHGEVAVRERREFIEQTQDGLLVALGFFALRERQGFAVAEVGFDRSHAAEHEEQRHRGGQRQHASSDYKQSRGRASRPQPRRAPRAPRKPASR